MSRISYGLVVAVNHLAGHGGAGEGWERRKNRKALYPHAGIALGLGGSRAGRTRHDAREKRHAPAQHVQTDTDHLVLLVFSQGNHLRGIHVHGDPGWALARKPIHIALKAAPIDLPIGVHGQERGGDHAVAGSLEHGRSQY